jgi:16S rRNA (guanine527-N7)-methyltransferase
MDLLGELKRQLQTLDLEVGLSAFEPLLTLQDELLRWNRTYNLTAITDPVEAIEKHLVDSLTLLPSLEEKNSLLDIGSGAGFPSLPLKIARPGMAVVSVDAVGKKIRFQKHVVRKLGLTGFTPWHGRAEDLPGQDVAATGFDLVVARAFASIPKLLELARFCLKPGGTIVAMKGPEAESELMAATDWLDKNGFCCQERLQLRLPASGSIRELLFFGLQKHHM